MRAPDVAIEWKVGETGGQRLKAGNPYLSHVGADGRDLLRACSHG